VQSPCSSKSFAPLKQLHLDNTKTKTPHRNFFQIGTDLIDLGLHTYLRELRTQLAVKSSQELMQMRNGPFRKEQGFYYSVFIFAETHKILPWAS